MADDSGVNFGDILVAIAVTTAAFYGQAALNSALAGSQGGAGGSLDYALKQTTPPCQIYVGDYACAAPVYAFYEVASNAIVSVQLVNDGRLDSYDTFFLNDDHVATDGTGRVTTVYSGTTAYTDGRYVDSPGQRVNIQSRLGIPTETAYADVIARFPGKWTSNHRGDGTASVCMQCFAPETKFFSQAFPNGRPELRVAARAVCYDWRDPSQARLLPETWKWSANPVVWEVHLEWFRWGLDWTRQIAPVLDDLTYEADYCDDPIDLNAGGTEPRYRVAGVYKDNEDIGSIRTKILMTMDGMRSLDARGRLVVRAGRYIAPSVTLTTADLTSRDWMTGVQAENRIDRLQVFYTDRAQGYVKAQCDDWIINEDGDSVRDFYPEWCPSFTQARRLAKRFAYKAMPAGSGSFESNIGGLKTWGQPTVTISADLEDGLSSAVIALSGAPECKGLNGFSFSGVRIGPDIDAWNAAVEEGNPPTASSSALPSALTKPTINSATAYFEKLSDETWGVKIEIDATCDRSDATWLYWIKPSSGSTWQVVDSNLSGASVIMNTDFVSAGDTLDVQAQFRTGGNAYSPVSDPQTVSTSTAGLAPAKDTISSYSGGAGGYSVAWVNSASSNFAGSRLWRVPTGDALDYGTASDDTGLRMAASGTPDSASPTSISAGTWDIYVTAENGMGAKSATGPVTVTVT